MIVYRDKGLRVGAVLLDEEPESVKVDRQIFLYRTEPLEGANCEERHTLFLDLRKSSDELLAGFDKTTAYEVRRARDKDGVVCESLDPSDERSLDAFGDFFEKFSAAMDYPRWGPAGKRWLTLLAQNRKMSLTVAKNAVGEVLAYHVYYHGRKCVRLLHACSLHKLVGNTQERALIGRANRFLFWFDILRFKEEGRTICDFGGWWAFDDDPQRLRVNRFKEGFGGEVVRTYICTRGCTLRGRLAEWVRLALHGLSKKYRT